MNANLIAPLIHKARDEVASVQRKLEHVDYDAEKNTLVFHCDQVVDGNLEFASCKDRIGETTITPAMVRTDYVDAGDLFVTGSAMIEELRVKKLRIGNDGGSELDLSSLMGSIKHQHVSEDGQATIFDKDVEVQGKLSATSLCVSGPAIKNGSACWAYPSDDKLMTDIREADLDCCYSIVRELPLKKFAWKGEGPHLGFRTEDVQNFFPKSVKDNHVDVGQVYVSMFGAVQKLMETLEDLSSRIHRLEQQINLN